MKESKTEIKVPLTAVIYGCIFTACSFTTVPGIMWIVTAAVLLLYRLNKQKYSQIIKEISERKK